MYRLFSILFVVFIAICSVMAQDSACNSPIKAGSCKARKPRYAYNAQEGKCIRFAYSGCMGNDNRFNTLEECEAACKP